MLTEGLGSGVGVGVGLSSPNVVLQTQKKKKGICGRHLHSAGVQNPLPVSSNEYLKRI